MDEYTRRSPLINAFATLWRTDPEIAEAGVRQLAVLFRAASSAAMDADAGLLVDELDQVSTDLSDLVADNSEA